MCFWQRLGPLNIREATQEDQLIIWETTLEPVFRAGEAFCVPLDITRVDGIAYWFDDQYAQGGRVYVVEEQTKDGKPSKTPLGSYFITPHRPGNVPASSKQCAHVAGCSFITASAIRGRGVARAMLRHAIQTAAIDGFQGILLHVWNPQKRVAKCLWRRASFVEVGRLPAAFMHPSRGFLDALLLYRRADQNDLTAWLHDTRTGSGLEGHFASAITNAEGDGDDDEWTVHPVSQLTEQYLAEQADLDKQKLPAAQRLPPPRRTVLDETGYSADSWNPAHLCLRLAYKLDTVMVSLQQQASPRPDLMNTSPRSDYDS